eukprot:CAMPEP_0198598784 /NCGR_PEP_ID=MMETSP1462-20131121/146132_1 /TAXON_ID=1333877 /ORGANISM="Brandtodinium nutriculum, Strain RCC3387" /LENGTH=58 /DNA_ID=CAMNT_0044330457 /DNA_START=42 /DNA_END=215 /DNA_ORIENTATION=+
MTKAVPPSSTKLASPAREASPASLRGGSGAFSGSLGGASPEMLPGAAGGLAGTGGGAA